MSDASKLLKSMVKGKGSILVPHIDAYLERAKFPDVWNLQIRNYKEDDGFYHPSSHAFSDPRHLYFDRLGARTGEYLVPKRHIGASLARTFACGHMWHEYIGRLLVDMGLVDEENVERHDKYPIETEYGKVTGSGTIDLLDVEIPGHGEWLVDMKTVNKAEFERGIADYTMMKWEAQVNLYGDWVGREKMMVLAIEKDSPHRLMEFQIRRNDLLIEEIYARWVYTEIHLQEGNPPPCEHPFGAICELGPQCGYYGVEDE